MEKKKREKKPTQQKIQQIPLQKNKKKWQKRQLKNSNH